MTSPPSSLIAMAKVERVRSEGFSNSTAMCRPESAFARGPCRPSARSSLRVAARSKQVSRASGEKSSMDRKCLGGCGRVSRDAASGFERLPEARREPGG